MESTSAALSPGQRLLWQMGRLRPDLGALNCPVAVELSGPLDRQALQTALSGLVARHEALRTRFVGRGRSLRQVVDLDSDPPLANADLSQENSPSVRLAERLAGELSTPIDVESSPLRATLFKLSSDRHVLCLTITHLVTDAWSTGVLMRDLCDLYREATGLGAGPPPLVRSVLDELEERARFERTEAFSRLGARWATTLRDAPLPNVPRGPVVPALANPTGTLTHSFRPGTTARTAASAARWRTTPFVVMLTAFGLALRSLNGQQDFAVASLFANRMNPESHDLVGFLANMVLLRLALPSAARPPELIGSVHATTLKAIAGQSFPYHMLPAGTVSSASGRPDDVVFQMMTDPGARRRVGDLELVLMLPEAIGSRFGLELAIAPVTGEYRAVLFYRLDWCDEEWASGLLASFVASVEELTGEPGVRVPTDRT